MTLSASLCAALVVVVLAVRLRPRARPPLAAVASHASAEDGALAAMEDVERELRSGAALQPSIITALGRRPRTLPGVRVALEQGALLTAALHHADAADPAELLAVQTWRACGRAGGPTGDAVGRAVLVLRERRTWQRERAVAAAQARLSATVLTLIPVVFAGWSAATSARIRHAYAEIPLCTVAALLGLLLNAVGWLWMRSLVRGPS